MLERAHRDESFRVPELRHGCGQCVSLLADPARLTLLARLCRPETLQPDVASLIRDIHKNLLRLVVANQLPRREAEERGLHDHPYIAPGAGGLGEILNNSYV
jgi:hypothetical protein